ncbi:hypothetical protein [Paraburkholderia unamae]|uniref:Lipoprotein n=1 Tax=Paraburkholderia unamae TaxID=219649 RepID=A0ABX5KG33_9BURK|nr:hypothetical protein [Paraburkholderia unamae]PVX77196.1 hypothetical protein C7402_115255 [Paraburkholderia unamae]
MRPILIALPCLLAACATVHESYAPDGQKAYTLNCSGMARGWDKCFSKAGELCGAHGYSVIDRNGESGAVFGGTSNGWGGGSTMERSMVVECKNP